MIIKSYKDGRPAARYRLEVSDHGPVMRPGDRVGLCDHLGARDAIVFRDKDLY